MRRKEIAAGLHNTFKVKVELRLPKADVARIRRLGGALGAQA
jgi:hypothetical protein